MPDMSRNQKPVITIVAALNCEAKPWVDYFGLKKQCDKPFWYYARSPIDSSSKECVKEGIDVEVVISGIGSLAMATAIGWVGASATRPRAWLNLGIAGHATMPVGTVCRVHSVINANDLAKYHPPLIAKWRGETSAIATVNVPTNSYAEGAMIDMESYAFFQAARMFSAAELVQSIKVISDNQEQGFEQLNASKITALMCPHIEVVNEFIRALVNLAPEREVEHPWAYLLQARGTHSQHQQLDGLLKRAAVLGLQKQVSLLNLNRQTPVKAMLKQLQALLESSAPQIGHAVLGGAG